MAGHGAPTGVDMALWLSDDPELGLVRADLHAWAEAHPCECEALCTCDRYTRGGLMGHMLADEVEELRQRLESAETMLASQERVRELEAALNDACDVAIWMSGSPSFSAEGEAHEGWLKMREKLYAAMKALPEAERA